MKHASRVAVMLLALIVCMNTLEVTFPKKFKCASPTMSFGSNSPLENLTLVLAYSSFCKPSAQFFALPTAVLVTVRGCSYETQARHLQNSNASAIVWISGGLPGREWSVWDGSDVSDIRLPSLIVSQSDGVGLAKLIATSSIVSVTASSDPNQWDALRYSAAYVVFSAIYGAFCLSAVLWASYKLFWFLWSFLRSGRKRHLACWVLFLQIFANCIRLVNSTDPLLLHHFWIWRSWRPCLTISAPAALISVALSLVYWHSNTGKFKIVNRIFRNEKLKYFFLVVVVCICVVDLTTMSLDTMYMGGGYLNLVIGLSYALMYGSLGIASIVVGFKIRNEFSKRATITAVNMAENTGSIMLGLTNKMIMGGCFMLVTVIAAGLGASSFYNTPIGQSLTYVIANVSILGESFTLIAIFKARKASHVEVDSNLQLSPSSTRNTSSVNS